MFIITIININEIIKDIIIIFKKIIISIGPGNILKTLDRIMKLIVKEKKNKIMVINSFFVNLKIGHPDNPIISSSYTLIYYKHLVIFTNINKISILIL